MPEPTSASQRIYRVLLRRAFPGLSGRAETEMVEVFRDAYRDARAERRPLWRSRLWMLALADLLATLLAMRRERGAAASLHSSHGSSLPKEKSMYDALRTDLRYAFRTLSRERALTLIVTLTLALGIGANTAVFSIVNAVVLAPLNYEDPAGLVLLNETVNETDEMSVAYPNYRDWKQRSRSFESMAAVRFDSATVAGETPEWATVLLASAELFPVIGTEPVTGRVFTAEEDRIGGPEVVLLTYGFWQRRYGGDAGVVGRTIDLDGQAHTIIGVLPPSFVQPPLADDVAMVLPLNVYAESFAEARGRHPGIYVIARLRAGVTLQAARDEMDGISAALAKEYPGTNGGLGVHVAPLHEVVVEDARPTLLMVWGAVATVLLIACINVAGLLVARAAKRQSELAIRVALGAARMRVVRQLLVESVVLSGIGGLAGLLLAGWGIRALIAIYPGDLPRLDNAGLDVTVLAFTALLSLGCGILAGLAPALEASRPDPYRGLRQGGELSSGRHRQRARSALLAAQLALSVVLLVAAGMLGRSLGNVLSEGPGFDAAGVLAVRIALPGNRYPEAAQQARFFGELVDRVEALPGVVSAATVGALPLGGNRAGYSFYLIEGEPEVDTSRQRPLIDYSEASPGYFRTLGIPLLQGRGFEASDSADSTPVAIVDERFARQHLAGADPVGRRLKLGSMQADSGVPWLEVVGVVSSVASRGVTAQAPPLVYVPVSQAYRPNSLSLVVRGTSGLDTLAEAVRGQVHELDPDLPLLDVSSVDAYLDEANAPQRFAALVIGGFAAAALLLATLGIYGVTSFYVARRNHEIGLRMALGARRVDVITLVLQQWLPVATVGVASGLVGSIVLMRFLHGMLYEVSPTDTVSFVSGTAVLLVAMLAASVLPANRAARIDPLEAIRED
jgi:putative ABC transport system permease protein